MTKKRMPVAERRQETGTCGGPSAGRLGITGRIRGSMPGPERVLTWSGGPVRRSMIDDSRTDGHVGRHGAAVVNGPEDDSTRLEVD